MIYFPYFLDSGSVLGSVGFEYVRTTRFYISYFSTAALTFLSLMTGIQKRRCCIIYLADDNSKCSWNTLDRSRTIRCKSMTSANGGTYAGQYPCSG